MGRAKKATEKYTMDFKLPLRSRALMFNPDDSKRYTIPQMLEFAAKNPGNYAESFVPSVKAQYEANGTLSEQQIYTLENLAADFCTASEELDKEFLAWYASRPDIQEVYKVAAPDQYWWHNPGGNGYTSAEEAKERGWCDAPPNWQSFLRVWHGHAAHKYRELNRDIIYDIGDMVQIRAPFVGSWRHDPMYSTDRATARIGTVVEHEEALDRKSRGGKGSRLINVLWLNNGETKAVPERVIKKLPKQK